MENCGRTMLRSVVFVFLCCTISTASTLDYPRALSHSKAEAFCKTFGLGLRAPKKEYLEEILSKSAHNLTHVSFYLPERSFSGVLCRILQTYSKNAKIHSIKTFGSCESQRYFSCGPLTRFQNRAEPPPAVKDGKYGIVEPVGPDEFNAGDREGRTEKDDGSSNEDAKDGDNDGETEKTTTTTGGEKIIDPATTQSHASEDETTTVEQEVTTTEALSTTDSEASDDENNTDGVEWSGIRTATIVFCPINGIILSVCVWSFCCTEFMKSVRTTLHLHLCGLLLLGQLSLIISSSQCSSAVGAQLHFVFLASVTFSTLEGIHLIQASFSDEAPSMSLFYIAVGYAVPLIFASAGFAKLRNHYVQAEQLCILDLDTGAGWLMLGPVIVMIVTNIAAVLTYECRISFLSENAANFPTHLEARARLIRSLSVTTFFLGLQWIFGSVIQSGTGAFSVLFLLFNLATNIAILVNHVACDRDTRACMARQLGSRGKFAQRLADILRPPPPKVNGLSERVSYHTPPRVSETLRSTLDRGIRPSIHLITPLDHIPVSR